MKHSIQKRFGQTVKRHRVRLNLTQEELADLTELHRTYISSVELGNRNISLRNIEKIAKVFKCTPSKLLE